MEIKNKLTVTRRAGEGGNGGKREGSSKNMYKGHMRCGPVAQWITCLTMDQKILGDTDTWAILGLRVGGGDGWGGGQ